METEQMLESAGLSRATLAKAFGVTPQRISQILSGRGVSFGLADDLRRYINRTCGYPLCSNEQFMRKAGTRRR